MSGVEQITEIHRGARNVLVRTRGGARDAVRKQVRPEIADRETALIRLRHEHEVLSSLVLPGVVRALGWEETTAGPALWLEDVGPRNLKQWLEGKPLAVPAFLRLAIQLAEHVAGLHRRAIIHGNLSPGNVVIDGERLTLIDFGAAALSTPGTGVATEPDSELLYIAPERTGRMNRRADRRADLYSLGAVFYEMLAGTPPFPARDPVELVHAHLALSPRALPGTVPALLSDLVLRLLAKTPEQRYQSTGGLLADLREAAARLDATGTVSPFELGQADLGADLPADRLYGREPEIDQLHAAWERTLAGGREVVLVTGEAGAGKSELLVGLEAVVSGGGGRFAAGKADLRRTHTPFGPVVSALRPLVLGLAQAPQAETAAVRGRLAAALRAGGATITALIPELEALIGPTAALPALGPREAEGRFLAVFVAFIGALASEDHPVVLFVDDLQWADSASITLLRRLAATADLRHFLLLLASRDEGSDPGAAVVDPQAMAEAGTRLSRLPLGPLPLPALTSLCRDLLDCSELQARPLAEVLAAKSGGNPLFFRRLLRHLQQSELVVRESAGGPWTWDVDRIATVGVTDNVGDLMAQGLRRLTPAARALLAAGACLGRTFTLGLVAEVQGLALPVAAGALGEAIAAGQVLALERTPAGIRPGDHFQFAHDRVQQAADAMLSGADRADIHLRIGRRLLSGSGVGEQPGPPIFEIVDHLNRGAESIADPSERLRVATLGRDAERRARAASAYGPAMEYLERALSLLPTDVWQSDYELAMSLHRDAIECGLWTGKAALAERLFETALSRASDRLERAELYRTRLVSAFAVGDYPTALRWGREGLALFGIELPAADDAAAAGRELLAAETHLAARPPRELLDGPIMRSPELLVRMDLLAPLQTAAYYLSPSLWTFAVGRLVNLTLEHGLSVASAEGIVSLGAVALFGSQDPARGYERGRLGLEVARKMGDRGSLARATTVFSSVLQMWRESFDECLATLGRVHDAAIEAGELAYAFANGATAVITLFHRGAELTRVQAQIDAALKLVEPGLSKLETQRVLGLRDLILRLQGIPSGGQETPDGSAEMGVCYLMGEIGQARALAQGPGQAAPVTRTVQMVDRAFYGALTSAAVYRDAPPDERPALLAAIAAAQARLDSWAEGCPENFRHKALLVAAERARLEERPLEAADLYDRAATEAAANRFLQDEGLANELAARFHRVQGRPHFALTYAARALPAYARWGARAKVAALQDEFPAMAAEQATVQGGGATLDLLALLRAAETLSREVVLDRLCGKLIEVCLATAGAERAVLVLAEEDGLYVRALGAVHGTAESLRQPLVRSSEIPAGIIEHALRTGQPLVLADARQHPELGTDPYVAGHGVRSALALPILHQGKLVGALYLENNLATRVFVPERVRLLQLLSSQIATSIQNSQLFERLTREVEDRTRAEEAVRFLAEAGEALSASLDYEATLANAARVAVAGLADGCLIFALEHDTVRLTAAAHRDPARQERLAVRMREPLLVPPSLGEWLRAQESAHAEALTPALLERYAPPSLREDLLPEPGHPSVALLVPLSVHGRRVAVMTMVVAAPDGAAAGRALALGEELARRAAMAIENARLYGEAQETIRIRDEFLSISSHELKTPLTSLRLMVDAFEQAVLGGSPEAAKGAATMVSRQTRRLERLVSDLLDVTSIRSGRLSMHLDSVDLPALVRDVADRFGPQLAAAGCALTVEVPPALRGSWDRERLDQVLSNLLSNAIKFGAGQPIAITAQADASLARMTIVDHGIGIPRDRLPHIFGRFERAASYHYGGLGLGLYIANQIVTAMGGRLSVESSPGAGSTFTVELPT
jgi:predicted ATPase/signal transduction histidine kinase/tRNA A-37 threonylcarbamoyl transferase component Bud32